ncbi:MAG: GNAT family N-acetyltransferase [Gammaproteobacteria bacterium]|nr:GNAT family N-acetyltransferase [Gammaproteobacteria bacterium]MCY4218573.1 GNAT family N-acetyltransferase [Gammaproteobacteria bacterium]MCY4275712.1 GNAT family N-acetyltransferase [Gammaproteobacteria bacterium]
MGVEVRPAALSEPQILRLISKLDRYQSKLYPAESNHLESPHELEQADAYLVGAYLLDHVVGIGAVKIVTSTGYGEIKRVYVDENNRGHGIARMIMETLEEYAKYQGCHSLMLETGIYQKSAIKLYENLGFCYRNAFGDYPIDDPNSVFMEKLLISKRG